MPQTNNQIVTEAYQTIGVVADGKPCTPTQGQVGITVMNDMLTSEAVDGLRINFVPQNFQTQWNSQAPVADANIGDVKYMLAERLAAKNGIKIDPQEDLTLYTLISEAKTRLVKRSLRMFESDLGELPRAQSSVTGSGNYI